MSRREDEKHLYDQHVCKGEQALDRILHAAPSSRVYGRQDLLDAWEPVQRRGGVLVEMLPVLWGLDVLSGANYVKGVATFQSKHFVTPDGVSHLIIDHSNILGKKIPAIRVFTLLMPARKICCMLLDLRGTVEGPE
ncbi:MAG: hypothetical protein Q9223_003548 [Gallowayella weberi]